MSDEFDGDAGTGGESQESGSSLRAKLEGALDANKTLTAELAREKAHRVISEKGLDLVSPEDFEGASPDEIAEKAEALQQTRLEMTTKLLAGRLGIDDPAEIEGLLNGSTDGEAEARKRVRDAGSGEAPRGTTEKFEGKQGVSRIAAALNPDT